MIDQKKTFYIIYTHSYIETDVELLFTGFLKKVVIIY